MGSNNKLLALVIPAYKLDYLDAALDSLVRQTNKDFNVYIGIDASPYNLEEVIGRYQTKLSISTIRFKNNLGGKDLVAQWERCITMTNDEPWIWLFSDDDLIGPKCVELFYQEIEKEKKYDIYHFNTTIIDRVGNIIKKTKSYPKIYDSKKFYKAKSRGKIESFVVENVFSRDIYQKIGGFVKFDLAWGSDTATWAMMASNKGIKTIYGDYVYWRKSDKNITPKINPIVLQRKLYAGVEFIKWANSYWLSSVRLFNHYAFFLMYFYYFGHMNDQMKDKLLQAALNNKIITRIEVCAYNYLNPLVTFLRKMI